MKSIGQDWKAAGHARQMLWRGTLYQSRLAKNFHGQANMIHNGTTANKPPVSSGNKGGQMIVEESFGNFINVYVDGYVFTADREKRQWDFGDGDNTPERLNAESSRRGMTGDEFTQHYRNICHAVAGWEGSQWAYRYNVVAMEGSSTQMLQDVFDHVEEMISRSGAGQDKSKCETILKTYASRPMIRSNGMRIMKYIVGTEDVNKRRIVYQMDELTPFEIESLIPAEVLQRSVNRNK